jgi:hypothetical protein
VRWVVTNATTKTRRREEEFLDSSGLRVFVVAFDRRVQSMRYGNAIAV